MRRSEALQGVRMIRFRSGLGRYEANELNQIEASEMLGVSERTFRRWCRRFEEEGETHLVLTRRSFSMREHRGEIALPGGRSDPDETPIATALREAREEVGINETAVRVVGWLSPLVTLALGSAIWPVIGFLKERPVMVTDPAEVDRAFTVPLAELLDDGTFLEERWRREQLRPGADSDGYFPIYFYRVPGDLIWGATARVVTELLCVVTGVEWPEAKRAWP